MMDIEEAYHQLHSSQRAYSELDGSGAFRLDEAPYLFNNPNCDWERYFIRQFGTEHERVTVIADSIAEIGVLVMSDGLSRWTETERLFVSAYFLPSSTTDFLEYAPVGSDLRKVWDMICFAAPVFYDARKERGRVFYIDGIDVPLVEIPRCSVQAAWAIAGQCLINKINSILTTTDHGNKPDRWAECWESILSADTEFGSVVLAKKMEEIFSVLSGERVEQQAKHALDVWGESYYAYSNGLCTEYILKNIAVLTGNAETDKELMELYRCIGALEIWNTVELRSSYKNGKIKMEPYFYSMMERIKKARKASGIDAMLSMIVDNGIPMDAVLL